MKLFSPSICCSLLIWICEPAFAGNNVNYEEAPIHYSATHPVANDVARLQTALESGSLKLHKDEKFGYLPSLLEELEIPVDSQALVFSKTSLQNDKIGPTTPRAIYFNDRVHVGYVQNGVIEIAAADSKLGMAFYTLDPRQDEPPKIERQSNRCMSCHGVARTRSVPGVLVRSVYPDKTGTPVVAAGSHQSTHRSPIAQRWGGWFVTGTHGRQTHLGNYVLDQPKKPKVFSNEAGMNRSSLEDRLDTSRYLRPTSDIVALMVLEHQSDGYNLLTQANFVAQHALFQRQTSLASGGDKSAADKECRERMLGAVSPLFDYLFFEGESVLNEPVRGSPEFVHAFELAGQFTPQARSLWELDLNAHLFKHPLSYLVYSPVIEGFPEELKSLMAEQLEIRLDQESVGPKFWMSKSDQAAVKQILGESRPRWLAQLQNQKR